MKKNNEQLDLYNLKGTVSREILNYQEYNKKGSFGLQLYSTAVNLAGSLYMTYNNIDDNLLTLIVKNGITAFSCYELFLLINDIKKKKKSEEVLNNY